MTTNDTRFNVININVGILGHVDSGKTTLTKAMSAIKSTASFDSSPQSVARGITLDLGFSGLFVPLTSITSSHVNGDHCDNEEVQIHTEERNEKEDSKLGSCGEIIQSPSKEKDKSEKSRSVIYTVPPDALEKYHRVLGNSYDIDTKYGNTASDATNTTGSNINSSSNDRTGVQLTFVDCPGHGSLIRTIIAGANIVDIMILVIDATKGVQAQTAECVAAGQALRKRIIVVINKCDKLIPHETVEEVRVRQELLGLWGRDPNNHHILDDGETGDFIIDTDQSADLLAKLIGLYRKRLEAQSEAIRELKLMVNNFFRSGTAWTEGVPFVEVSAGGVSGDTEELLMNSNKAKDTPDLFMDSCGDVHRVVERILCLVDPISLQQQRGVINNYNNSITHIPKYNKYGFILLADHCFSAGKGHNGAVVTGTVVCGSVEVGDSISIVDHSKVMMDAGVCGPVVSYTPVRAGMYDLLLPPNHSNSSLSTPAYITGLVVKSIQVFKQSVRTASMGDRCGICVSSSGNRSGSTSTNKGRIDVSAVERALIGGCKVIGAGFGLQVLLSDQSGGNDTAAMASQKCSNQTRVRELGKVSKRSADAMARIGILNTNVMYMVREAAELLLNRSFGGGASAAWNWPQAERYKEYINDNKNSKIFQKNQHSQDNDNIFIPISVTSYAALTAVGAAWCGNSNNEVSALYTLLVLSRESMISIGSTTTHKSTPRCICYTNNEINNNNNAHDVIDSPKPMQLSSAKETNSNNMSIPPYIPISLFLQRSAVVLNANCFHRYCQEGTSIQDR